MPIGNSVQKANYEEASCYLLNEFIYLKDSSLQNKRLMINLIYTELNLCSKGAD